MDELVARVRALSGRRSTQARKLQVSDLVLNLNQKTATRADESLRLSPTGLRLLEYLMRASPDPVKRQTLIAAVWGDEQPDSNSLKVHIHNLRKQIDSPDKPVLLHTIAGLGYAIKVEA
jgi:DNA-binding response OmpR family regulator